MNTLDDLRNNLDVQDKALLFTDALVPVLGRAALANLLEVDSFGRWQNLVDCQEAPKEKVELLEAVLSGFEALATNAEIDILPKGVRDAVENSIGDPQFAVYVLAEYVRTQNRVDRFTRAHEMAVFCTKVGEDERRNPPELDDGTGRRHDEGSGLSMG